MLAGCSSSSTLLSPRHRLRSEAPSPQFQACHFPMNTAQRLDLPCTASFARKDSSRAVPATAGLSIEDPKTKTTNSLKQSIRLPPLATPAIGESYWERVNNVATKKKKSLKRFADDCYDETLVKRKRGIVSTNVDHDQEEDDGGGEERDCVDNDHERLRISQFWFNPQVHFTSITTLCSGSEGGEDQNQPRICYAPTESNSSPAIFPFQNYPWINSVVTETTDSGGATAGGDDNSGAGDRIPIEGSSAASSASSGHTAVPAIAGTDRELGNGSRNPIQYAGAGAGTAEEAEAFELVSYLTSCVEAIGARSVHGISHYIAKLGGAASPRGETPLHRLMAYYAEALALRSARLWPQVFHITPPRDFERIVDDDSSSASALRILNQVTPIPRFIHFTANEMLLRAFEGKERVHIIDFDIKQGLQWPSLFQSLASRANPPNHVRITGVGDSKHELIETGERLAGFAAALNLAFEFHAVVEDRPEDVRLWMLHVKEGESVAVNCALQLHRTLRDGSGNALRDLLALIRSANPVAVAVAEQEAEHDGAWLETRVCNSLKYYAALFDAVGAGAGTAGLPPWSAARGRVEEMFGREIRNIVACEGADRTERHVGFSKWRRMMEDGGVGGGGGFRRVAPGPAAVMQGRMLLRMYGCEEGQNGYFIREHEEGGGVTLGWQDQPLFTVSAWVPIGSG